MHHSDQSETIEHAVSHFNGLDWLNDSAAFQLEVALAAVLSLSSQRTTTSPGWEPLSENEHERLLSSVYRALSDTILSLSRRVPFDRLSAGLLAAARIAENLKTGDFKNDRHRDAASQVKILIHYCRVCQHEDDIENRRRGRKAASISSLLPSKTSEVFG